MLFTTNLILKILIKEITMRLFHQLMMIMTTCFICTAVFAEETMAHALPLESAAATHHDTPAKPIPTHQKTNLNKATAQELLQVKGLNTSKVRAIITYRKKNNGFKALEELSQVKGMKRLKPEEMKEIQSQLKL